MQAGKETQMLMVEISQHDGRMNEGGRQYKITQSAYKERGVTKDTRVESVSCDFPS